ncbi:hypothetical protein GE061_006508, partial [Apolygus lucorum]
IGKRETVHKDVLADRWKGVCLNPKALQDLLDVGMFDDDVSWLEFLAICVGTLEPSLTRTMIELCELLTDEPEGGRASIPVTIFLNLYKYLAKLDCGPVNRLEQYEKTLIPDTETQCQATDLWPTQEIKEPEDVNIDWDTAIKGTPQDFIETGGDDADEGIVVEAAETENNEDEIVSDSVEQVKEVAEKDDQLAQLVEGSAENGEGSSEQVDETAENDESAERSEETVEKVVESPEQVEEPAGEGDESPENGVKSAVQVEEIAEKGDESTEQVEETAGVGDESAEQVEETAEKGDESTKQVEETAEMSDEPAGQIEETVEKVGVSAEQAEESPDKSDESTEQVSETGEKGEELKNEVEKTVEEGDKSPEEVENPAEVGENPAEQVEETAEKDVAEQVEAVDTEIAELSKAESEENVNANDEETTKTEAEIVSKDEETKEGEVSEEIVKNAEGEVSNAEEQIEANEGQLGDSVKDDAKEGEEQKEENNEVEGNVDEGNAGSKGEDQEESEGDVLGNKNESSVEEPVKTKADEPTETDGAVDEAASPGDGNETGDVEANADNVSQLKGAADEPSGVDEGQRGTDAEDQTVDDAGKNATADEGKEAKSVDDIVDGDNGEEPPAVDDTKDEKIVPTEIVQEESAEPGAEESVEVSTTSDNDDAKEQDDTESAKEAVVEENTTSELPEKENVTEDESGYESSQLQEDTKLSVQETIDPKSAYIINDDGTLSAPRAESVQEEDALQERDSDNSVITKGSDDGMMVWPDIKPPEKEEVDLEPVLEKEVTSEDGIEVFTDIEMQPPTEELKVLPEATEEEQVEVAETEENIFAPQIDSFTDLLEAESAPVEETNPEQLAAALQSTELAPEDMAGVIMSLEGGESFGEEGISQGPPESGTLSFPDGKPEELEQKKERKIVEVFEQHRYPKWMYIPGIGPTVPDHIIEEAEKYFLKIAELQEGMVMPRNIKHFHCPPLELVPECPEGIAEGL